MRLQIVQDDPYLGPYEHFFVRLRAKMNNIIQSFQGEGGLNQVSLSYKHYGLHEVQGRFVYKEWAPAAAQLSIFGDFNGWNRNEFQCQRDQFGIWSCVIDQTIERYSKLKSQVTTSDGRVFDRIPAWINYTHQRPDHSFDGVYAEPNQYKFINQRPVWNEKTALRIYECHIGMSGVEPEVHSFSSFREKVLPYVARSGYNVLQIMGVLEHPYYGSFGYHVTNFFSVSSRFGSIESFQQLVDEAHGLGIKVIIDLVHSHAAKNCDQGLSLWDGTEYQYFHAGDRGKHPLWDSKVFDYSKYEVQRFLLANIRFWLQQYQADGFRFDGITSMLYQHHGANFCFTGHYDLYFNESLDQDAIAYLMTATTLAKSLLPGVILIAQDVSGLPGLCREVGEGGIGFTHRLSMAIPDMWIKLLKDRRDQDWNLGQIVHELSNRREKERTIGYAESHDQALVGDKTISMWLFDSEIYTHMSTLNEETPRIFRGMALHKLIRLLTLTMSGEGYLTFMGNQFGHPEWIDFPREGNNWSYHYCRRRWDLLRNQSLRYSQLGSFDEAIINMDAAFKVLGSQNPHIRTINESDKIIVFERANLLFVFNFHPNVSYDSYTVYTKRASKATVLIQTDDSRFGGHGRVAHQEYGLHQHDSCSKFQLYLPNRTAVVLNIDV